MFNGRIEDVFGEVVGYYWYRPSTMSYTFEWHGIRHEGYTLEGIREWANALDFDLVEWK